MNVYMCHYQQQNLQAKMRLSEPPSLTSLQVFASHYEIYFHTRGSEDRDIAVYNRRGGNSTPKIITIN
jgi:hypothetical protein